MKALRYRLLICLLFAMLLTAAFGMPVPAEAERTCGENLTWRLEGSRLIISGTGEMDNFLEPYEPAAGKMSRAPWIEYSYQIREIVIEEGVTSVGNYAFMSLGWITSVSLPDGLISIGKMAFCHCSVTEIRIPDSVMEIKENAFTGCENLESITLPDKLQAIEFGTFQNCNKLKGVTLPASVKILEDDVFLGCESLEEIDLSSVSHIAGPAVFVNCTNLKNIIVAKGSIIEEYCVKNHLPYTAVEIPETAAPSEGTCGYNLTWKVENEKLTISGKGPMADFIINAGVAKPYLWYTVPGTTAPWDGEKFTELVIEEGVTSIGNYAFNCHTELISVTLPDSLKSIGDRAFEYCENMQDFLFPDFIEKIGPDAFADCRGLVNVVLPESLTALEYGTFQCCNAIKKVVLPANVKTIAAEAFYACFELKEISLPASLTRIDLAAFEDCEKLQNVIVEKDSYAEKFCKEVQLPYTYAETPVLSGNDGGEKLEWKLEDGILTISGTGKMNDFIRLMGGDKDTSAPWGGQKITRVVLEPGITSVGAFAFWGCEQLKTVVLPETVTEIGKFAFEGCNLLRNVILPEGVAEVGKKAFSQCDNLETVTLPASVSSIGEDAFALCRKLKNVVVNPGSYAEQYCLASNLPYMTGEAAPEATPVPVQSSIAEREKNPCGKDLSWIMEEDGTLRISGTGRMDNYEQVREETDQDGTVPVTGSSAPWNDRDIMRVVVEEGVTSIGSYAFENCAMMELSLPSTLTSVGDGAFDNCKELETVILPDSVTEIGMFAFNECTGLAEVRLPASLKSIGAAAFQTCVKLTELTLPEAVREVGMCAFTNCAGLKTVTLPASLQSLGEYAFDGCQALKAVIVPKGSYAEQYCIKKGIKYIYPGENPEAIPTAAPYGICGKNLTWKVDDNGTLLISGFGEMDDYELLFLNPDEDGYNTEQGSSAPWYGQDIRKIVIGQGVTRIGSSAFAGLKAVESVELPESLTSIGSLAFAYTSLTEVVIPDSVTSIGDSVFCDCRDLNSVRLPAGLQVIPESAFNGCVALKEIVLPDSLQRIELFAFQDCRGLKEITLPDSVFMIGAQAFENGPETCVVIPGSYAEEYCREKRVPYSYPDGTRPELPPVETAGSCGQDLTWNLENGTLTISGTGPMFDYEEDMEGLYTVGITAPWYGMAVHTVVVEEGVTTVGNYAFALLEEVRRVSLPETLVSIGEHAFWCCKITEIDIPDAVSKMGTQAFGNCEELRSVKLPKGIKRIEYGLFEACTELQEITIPDGVKSISDYVFYNCTALTTVRLPASVTSFGSYAFDGCPEVKVILTEKNERAEKFCDRNGIPYSYVENE